MCIGGPAKNQKTKAAKALEDKREKFLTSGWKLLSYSTQISADTAPLTIPLIAFFLAFGLWAIQTESHWFWDPYSYPLPYPGGQVPTRLISFYAMETGYYIFSCFAVFFEPKMKDRNQMFVHHLFTTFLLISSYVGNTTKFGVPIMLLHDLADPFLELSKLCLYSGYEFVKFCTPDVI